MKRIFLALLAVLWGAVPAMAGTGSDRTYMVDGAEYEGYLASGGQNAKGMVLIVHDWDGLTDYEKRRADMLAEMGYDAFAIDLYGKGNRPVETGARKAETGKLYKDRAKMRALILGGLAEAAKVTHAPMVAMGYCFGGAVVLELARSGKAEGVAGYATFHGGLKTPEGQRYPKDTPPVLIAHGGADRAIPMDQVAALSQELEAAGINYEIQVYSGAPHAFTVFGTGRYQKTADEKSWAAFRQFLAANLGN